MACYHMGINLGHDRSVAVVRDGEILVAIENERLDRIKHSVGYTLQAPGNATHIQLPLEAMTYCLDHLGIDYQDLTTITANMPGEDLTSTILTSRLPRTVARNVLQIPSHHLAHAYSAYWPSGFDSAIVLVVDGAGSTITQDGQRATESYTVYAATDTRLEVIHSEKVPAHLAGLSTLGFVYEHLTRLAGFVTHLADQLSVPEPGKLMGLAPYGRLQPALQPWFETRDGSYRIQISAYDILLELESIKQRYGVPAERPYLEPSVVDLAFKVQHELEQALIHIVSLAKRKTGLNRLCLAGGVALNSVANTKLLTEVQLADVFTFPAAGDSGIAAGCALWAYHTQELGRRRVRLRHAYLGRPYSAQEIDRALESFADAIEVQRLEPEALVKVSAGALARGHVIARFDGGSEYGPRALGHRSILADPTFREMKHILNARVKFRESFRPFAPIVPLESLSSVFEVDIPQPFMLMTPKVREVYRETLPAITHIDATGRVQSLTAEDNPYLYALCRAVEQIRGGPPVLLNTSFNVAGQPIVETPVEAIATFLSTDIDYLCLDDCWISKQGRRALSYEEHLRSDWAIFDPKGLETDMESVTALMDRLDRALFGDSAQHCPWPRHELERISREVGCYRETSRLFAQRFFAGRARTALSRIAVLLLDPLGESRAVSVKGKVLGRYSARDAETLLALQQPPTSLELSLRRRLGLTQAPLGERLAWGRAQLAALGASLHPAWQDQPEPPDSPVMQDGGRFLAAFDDPGFSLRRGLTQLYLRVRQHGYRSAAICRALGVETLQSIEPLHLHYFDRFRLPVDPLGDLIRLFLLRCALPHPRLVELLGEPLIDLLESLGVLIPRAGLWASRVDLYSVEDLLLATDHRYMLLDEDEMDEEPVMYIGADSFGLVQTAPRTPVRNTLDLCSGSGIQGLIASGYSEQVICVDINPRAVRLARFNAQLNGIDNLEVRLGSLYAAVPGERFDVILANPPFVPSPVRALGFRDGGGRGEDVLAEIVRGAGERLDAGGRLCVVTDLVDVADYRSRVEGWWRGGGADILVLKTADRDELLFSVPHAHAPFGQHLSDFNAALEVWVDNFRAEGLSGVNFGYLLLQRTSGSAGHYCARVVSNPTSSIRAEVEAYFSVCALLASGRAEEHHVVPHPDIILRTEGRPDTETTAWFLTSRGNPYFTTYPIGAGLAKLLGYIALKQPRLAEIGAGEDRSMVLDLIDKGILQLLERPRERSSPPAGTVQVTESIAELESKTTPTCLSTYLRRR